MSCTCRTCGGSVSAQSKTGLCRVCVLSDPEVVARRAEARRKAFLHNPELRAKQRQALAESNRQPHRRAQSGQQARSLKLWEYGLPKVDGDVRKRAGETLSNRMLADIPLAHRDDYAVLVRKVGADAARQIIKSHAAKVAERSFA